MKVSGFEHTFGFRFVLIHRIMWLYPAGQQYYVSHNDEHDIISADLSDAFCSTTKDESLWYALLCLLTRKPQCGYTLQCF